MTSHNLFRRRFVLHRQGENQEPVIPFSGIESDFSTPSTATLNTTINLGSALRSPAIANNHTVFGARLAAILGRGSARIDSSN